MNIYDYDIELTRFYAISSNECHVSKNASHEQTLKNCRIRILNLYIARTLEILILFENNDTTHTRKSMSLQDYGIIGFPMLQGIH